MIYTFRKEIGKWKLILWPVFISLAASSLVMVRRSSQTATVVTVNGDGVSSKDFSNRVRAIQEQINQLRGFARSSGIPMETFLQMYGLGDPASAALDAVVHERLIAGVLRPLWVSLHEDVVSSELLKNLPANFVDPAGGVDYAVYRDFMRQRNMHVSEFECKQEEEMYQGLFNDFVSFAAYAPRVVRQATLEEKLAKKSFGVIKVGFDKMLSCVQNEDLGTEEKEAYYDNHKEAYRVPEKRTFSYWVVSPDMAERKVDVPEEVVQRFYEKNRQTLYRIPPRVKVRHILVNEDSDAASKKLADELYAQVSENPEKFAELASEHSKDDDTANSGGVRDFFSRGTYDKDFEKAAFRLKNPQELAPVVKTDKGYEIIQLVERISASEKSLNDVRDEVEKSVRGKRALEWLRSHLERIRKDAENNTELVKEVTRAADSHKEVHNAVESDGNGYSLEGQIVKNGFGIRGVQSYGFFMHEDSYVLVQMTEKHGSYVPAYKDVRDAVEKDLQAKKARTLSQKVVADVRSDLLRGDAGHKVASTHDVRYDMSESISASELNAFPFKRAPGLLKKAFRLSDTGQVLTHHDGNDVYLVTLREVDEKSIDELSGGVDSTSHIDSEIKAQSNLLSRGFIASLRRSATIDVNEKILQLRPEAAAY